MNNQQAAAWSHLQGDISEVAFDSKVEVDLFEKTMKSDFHRVFTDLGIFFEPEVNEWTPGEPS